MSNVLVNKDKIDILANAISAKSGEPLTLTLDEMVEAVDSIEAGGGSAEPNLQTKSVIYTPSTSQQTDTVTADGGYDGLEEVDVTVSAIQTETKSATPTESAQTITPTSGNYLTEVTISAIPSNYVGSGITQRSSSDLTTSGATVSVPSGYYASNASKAVTSGTAGTPTATKGSVSNHSVSVTPSVTNTTGYITGSTKTGTAVTVSASELVSGSETKTANGTYDVTNLASLVVNVSGGGGGLTLLKTTSLGTLSISSTSATDTGKSLSVTGYADYDLLVVDVSVDTPVNGRHTSTVSFILVTGTSNVNTKNTYTVASNKWNSKLGSTGTGSTRQSTTAYGIYANSASVSSSTMTIPLYYRYNSNSTGTLNGTYTARIYGVKLYDLIGG